ncbi:hypothetical protein LWI28_000234 [Acer negundo]|uniref:Uncharacterized protein n=1 Tax=Acer negundo TaxID=4023 RepID=A0AAD5IYA2_ACENE|nr:hypothetical protein LWI28_000234 [Acer negundo]
MASGGNSSRNLNKEKGPMHNLLEHVGGDVNYDRSYHEFLQDQFGSDHPSSPNPPLIIPEFDGLNHDPNTPNTNENLSNPPPPSNDFFCSAITAPNHTRLPNPLDMARTGLISKEVTRPNLRNPITKPKLPGGNILEPRRSVMSPQSLEMQACVDDWTKAKYRQQELQPEIATSLKMTKPPVRKEATRFRSNFQTPTLSNLLKVKELRGL